MWKLSAILFIVIGPTMAGIGALVPLSVYGPDHFNPLMLAGAAACGLLLAIPASVLAGKHIRDMIQPSNRVA
ncbi:hypothetical protein [Pannonibacter indicus]|uniref:Uncharacterized protein n=1 Tax=Pannonibacter indicus TaxID=466044 RepID=A0A0K6HL98_9HYPH|nr:hypothetical protein [Pannonibacter indicus]CUA91644.1 hypothetical protein Ga0061067_1016 [Pannonibacter indicus]